MRFYEGIADVPEPLSLFSPPKVDPALKAAQKAQERQPEVTMATTGKRLTKRTVDALKPEQLIWDADVAGATVREINQVVEAVRANLNELLDALPTRGGGRDYVP